MSRATMAVTVDGIEKSFGETTALRGIDLELAEPSIVGVAGPNGSGKTTLLRCLLGVEAPTAGEARIDGVSARELDAAGRGRIGYMPQHRALYEDLTVRGNLAFFARLYGVENRAEAIDRALAAVALSDRADARIASLSGGMIRRTSLACALVHEPDLLVLDEPTVGLDPELRTAMWDAFRERRADGATIFVSTHYLDEASRCDRVLFLRDGRVLAFDEPQAHLERTGTDSMEAAFLALLEEER